MVSNPDLLFMKFKQLESWNQTNQNSAQFTWQESSVWLTYTRHVYWRNFEQDQPDSSPWHLIFPKQTDNTTQLRGADNEGEEAS